MARELPGGGRSVSMRNRLRTEVFALLINLTAVHQIRVATPRRRTARVAHGLAAGVPAGCGSPRPGRAVRPDKLGWQFR
ncbi:hypothetical protein MSEO_28040 [Mycobacterium seoulense]|uniref:Uncharacterized protein n=1 Tax=Mycobacterium seoulense TaxID=386911 RepID=A0A7I7P0M6_9MYCO|nr:hypothetical protein MSEO_28040 [Mycobacterium seoulense]